MQLHTFLISALDAGEWLTSRLGRFIPWKELRYQLNRRLCRPQSRYGHLGSEKLFAPTEIRNPDRLPSSVVTIVAHKIKIGNVHFFPYISVVISHQLSHYQTLPPTSKSECVCSTFIYSVGTYQITRRPVPKNFKNVTPLFTLTWCISEYYKVTPYLQVWKCDKVAFKSVKNISKCCYILVGRA